KLRADFAQDRQAADARVQHADRRLGEKGSGFGHIVSGPADGKAFFMEQARDRAGEQPLALATESTWSLRREPAQDLDLRSGVGFEPEILVSHHEAADGEPWRELSFVAVGAQALAERLDDEPLRREADVVMAGDAARDLDRLDDQVKPGDGPHEVDDPQVEDAAKDAAENRQAER